MMYIEQAYKGLTDLWRYVVGFIAIAGFYIIGQLPLAFVVMVRAVRNHTDIEGKTTNDLMDAAHLSPNMFTFLLLVTFVFGMFGVLLVVKQLHKMSWREFITTRKKIDWKRVLLSFGIIAVFIGLSTLIDYNQHPENYAINFKLVPFLILFVMSIILVPIQTSFEEFVFRGYLMQGLGVLTKNRWFPLLMTSAIFGLMHFANPEVAQYGPMIMFYYIGTGLLLGIMTLMDDGMELNLGFHAGNNLIQILLVTSTWTVFQSESILKDLSEPTSVGADIFVPLLVVYPILLIVFAKIYKWKNWKEKLFGKVQPPVATEDVDYIEE